MPSGLWNLEFQNQNSQRRYPLTEDSSVTDTSGTFTLPNSFLLELDLPISSGMNVDPSSFFIYQLGVYANGYSILLGYQPAGAGHRTCMAHRTSKRLAGPPKSAPKANRPNLEETLNRVVESGIRPIKRYRNNPDLLLKEHLRRDFWSPKAPAPPKA